MSKKVVLDKKGVMFYINGNIESAKEYAEIFAIHGKRLEGMAEELELSSFEPECAQLMIKVVEVLEELTKQAESLRDYLINRLHLNQQEQEKKQ